MDVVRENHRFLWDEDDDGPDTWCVSGRQQCKVVVTSLQRKLQIPSFV